MKMLKLKGVHKAISLMTIIAVVCGIILIPVSRVANAMSISSLSETQGSIEGGNKIQLKGSEFILNANDEIDQIYSKYNHHFAVSKTGRVYAWGANSYGQLGTGDTVSHSTPVDITDQFGGETIYQIAVGMSHSVAITKSWKVYAWGANNYGQLGAGVLEDGQTRQLTPLEITDQFNLETGIIIQVAAGLNHTAAVTGAGRIFTWGRNNSNQLGINDSNNYYTPQDITHHFSSLERPYAVIAGDEYTITKGFFDNVFAWGYNGYGSLGIDNSTGWVEEPYNITSIFNGEIISQISAGLGHTMAITNSGELLAWGYSASGQAGTGSIVNVIDSPRNITSLFPGDRVVKVGLGHQHSIVVTESGKVYSWGHNQTGQVGAFGVNDTRVLAPQDITDRFSGEGIKAIQGNTTGAIMLTKSGKVFSWGNANPDGVRYPQDTTNSFGQIPTIQPVSISFGSSVVTDFEVIDHETIDLIVPAHSAGFVDIEVVDINGNVINLYRGYEYIDSDSEGQGSLNAGGENNNSSKTESVDITAPNTGFAAK